MIETAVVSPEGHIVFPQDIQSGLFLSEGLRFVVYSDGENVLLKPVYLSEIPEFKKMMRQAQVLAKEAGLTEDDIVTSIHEVRAKNRVCGLL